METTITRLQQREMLTDEIAATLKLQVKTLHYTTLNTTCADVTHAKPTGLEDKASQMAKFPQLFSWSYASRTGGTKERQHADMYSNQWGAKPLTNGLKKSMF